MAKRSRKEVGRRIGEVIAASVASRKGRGWHGEPVRHAKAARGIKTAKPKRGFGPRLAGGNIQEARKSLGQWVDDSYTLPVHHIIDLSKGIVATEDATSIGSTKIYGETPRFMLVGEVFQLKGGMMSSLPESEVGKWGASLDFRDYTSGAGVDYRIFFWHERDKPFDTEQEAQRSIDKKAKEFLRGRPLEVAAKDEFARLKKEREAWIEDFTKRYEFQKMVKKLPKAD